MICGLVYLKRQRLACCGQYSGVAPEGKEEDEIVGYTELEVNSCDWPMEHRQVRTYMQPSPADTFHTTVERTYVHTYVRMVQCSATHVRTCVDMFVYIHVYKHLYLEALRDVLILYATQHSRQCSATQEHMYIRTYVCTIVCMHV